MKMIQGNWRRVWAIYADKTGVGDYNVEDMERGGLQFHRHQLHNVERYELRKTGKILFNHPEGTHDDRFWALALAMYAAEQAPPPPSRPIARTI